MAEFGLVKSFQIDDGQLDGLSPEECFVLGYELAEIDEMVGYDFRFDKPIHAENAFRIRASCEDAGRNYRLLWMEEDGSESWMLLIVEERE